MRSTTTAAVTHLARTTTLVSATLYLDNKCEHQCSNNNSVESTDHNTGNHTFPFHPDIERQLQVRDKNEWKIKIKRKIKNK